MAEVVVAGVDGSEPSVEAAHYAADLARRRGAPLRLIYVFESLVYGFGPMFASGGFGVAGEQLRDAARRALDEVTGQIRSAHPDVPVAGELREGGAAATLIAESTTDGVTVVASRGGGGFAGLPLGSVSGQVAAHARGAVVVVRPAPDPHGPVVVGFDGSPASAAALDFAVAEALTSDRSLVVTHVYWPRPWGFGERPAVDPDVTAAHEAERVVESAVEPYRSRHPRLRVEARTIRGLNPAHSLLEASAHAGLTVVGSRGRGGFAGLVLGSVGQSLVQHAAGPLAVVHAAPGGDDRADEQ